MLCDRAGHPDFLVNCPQFVWSRTFGREPIFPFGTVKRSSFFGAAWYLHIAMLVGCQLLNIMDFQVVVMILFAIYSLLVKNKNKDEMMKLI